MCYGQISGAGRKRAVSVEAEKDENGKIRYVAVEKGDSQLSHKWGLNRLDKVSHS